MLKYALLSLIIFLVSCSSNKVCRNPEGKEVDWYVIFFMPSSVSPDDKIHYGYFDRSLKDLKFYQYSESTFPPNYITKYAKGTQKDFNYFFWNDDKTLKGGEAINAPSSKAHAKGSLVYDQDNGAFLLHSLPRYPTRNSRNTILTELPSNGGSYGQNFLCITVNKNTAEQIARLLSCINVSNNKSVDTDRVNDPANPFVMDLIYNRINSVCNIQHTVKIKSKGNEVFTFFGKNYKNKIMPYEETLRQAYNDDFYVRTWSRPTLSPSVYDTFNIVNVLEIKIGNFQYELNKEHSKWGIAKKKNVVCFSDLNHTDSQRDRGGHIVCFENKKLHDILKKAIIQAEDDSLQMIQPSKNDELIEIMKKQIRNYN